MALLGHQSNLPVLLELKILIQLIDSLFLIRKHYVRIMNFKDQLFHLSPLFSENNILKFTDKISL